MVSIPLSNMVVALRSRGVWSGDGRPGTWRGGTREGGLILTILLVVALGQAASAQPASTEGATKPAETAPPDQTTQPLPVKEEEEAPGDMPPPPPDLVVLVDKANLKGRYRLGVFDRKADPTQPQVWRLNLWEQTQDRLFISTDVLNCSPSQPMRITGGTSRGDGRLILRELNPGGPITPSNRLDHQIWWAACFPDQAGKDPATLGAEARRRGFSGTLIEREQVVPGARRP